MSLQDNSKKSKLPLRLWFCDFPGPFNPLRLTQLLETRYQIIPDPDSPDYVIHSVFSRNFLRYDRAIRIFFTGENVHPDFNICDYAFGFDRMTFGDRYNRCPNYVLYDHYDELRRRQRTDDAQHSERAMFCNFIYSNRGGHPYRDEFFRMLSKYKFIHSPGAHLNNVQDTIAPAYSNDWCTPKVQYQSRFKFSFAFENSSSPGYTTEKLVHALAADTIPIYWGDPDVHLNFNTRRFINMHELTPEQAIDRVVQLDTNATLYRAVLQEPYFPLHPAHTPLSSEILLDQFSEILARPLLKARRRNQHFWGERYEREARDAACAVSFLSNRRPTALAARLLYKLWRGRGDT